MEYRLEELIDIPLLQNLQEKLNVIYSFPSAIIDNEGNILTAVAWQDICTKFHRTHPECEKECIKSDQYIIEHLHEAKPAVSYQCPHGLVDNATPIIIDGKHLGNFFTGQFFLEKPDLEFFKKQAEKYGFDESAYIEAVKKVPIWTKEKRTQYLDFIKGFIEIIAGFGLNNLKEIEINKALKESEERNLSIIKSTSDWVWEIDENGNYSYCSERVKDILGYSANKIVGKTPFDLMPSEEKESIRPIFNGILQAKGSIVDLENWNIHKDGHRVCLLTNGFPILDESGNVKGYRGADKDITERKEAELELKERNEEYEALNEELRQANEELSVAKKKAEESDLLKSTFLQNMSHEVRTPLNAIVGFSELIRKPNQSPEKLKQFSEAIAQSSDKLIRTITDIIDISQVQSNQVNVKLNELDIVAFLNNLVTQFTGKANDKNIDLQLNCKIPDKEYFILTDVEKLERVFAHLIDNAIKFTHKGKVEVASVVENNKLSIQIIDTGIGISSEMQSLIFEPFRQVETGIRRSYGGNGLGLPIVKAYVELLRGTIELDSELNRGTVFEVSFPVTNNIDNERVVIIPRTGSARAILIAEDEYSNYLYLLELLDESDVHVIYAENGQQAIDLCREKQEIDLVLMDIKMPIMDGYQAAKIIKEFRPSLPIIAQTAYALSSEKETFVDAFDDYLTKPINAKEFKQKLMRYIGKT